MIEHYAVILQQSFVDSVATHLIRKQCEKAKQQSGTATSGLYSWTQPRWQERDEAALANIVSRHNLEDEAIH